MTKIDTADTEDFDQSPVNGKNFTPVSFGNLIFRLRQVRSDYQDMFDLLPEDIQVDLADEFGEIEAELKSIRRLAETLNSRVVLT